MAAIASDRTRQFAVRTPLLQLFSALVDLASWFLIGTCAKSFVVDLCLRLKSSSSIAAKAALVIARHLQSSTFKMTMPCKIIGPSQRADLQACACLPHIQASMVGRHQPRPGKQAHANFPRTPLSCVNVRCDTINHESAMRDTDQSSLKGVERPVALQPRETLAQVCSAYPKLRPSCIVDTVRVAATRRRSSRRNGVS